MEKIYIDIEIEGPIPNAKRIVPIPATPPNTQPKVTTKTSIAVRTKASGKFEYFWRPVINPSLGPGPRFAIK